MKHFEVKEVEGIQTVICTLEEGNIKAKGKAKCNPTDAFDLGFGKRLAYTRAKLKFNNKMINRLIEYTLEFQSEIRRLDDQNSDLEMLEQARRLGKFCWGVFEGR